MFQAFFTDKSSRQGKKCYPHKCGVISNLAVRLWVDPWRPDMPD